MAKPKVSKLTQRQQAFVREYLKDLNATQAAIRAGYDSSLPSSKAQAGRMIAKPHIQAAIQAAMAERVERTEIDADWVLRRLHDEATADIADLLGDDGGVKPVTDWPMVWRRGLVAGIEVVETFRDDGDGRKLVGYTKKVKLTDRVRVVELIGKHIGVGAFRERLEHTMADVETLAQALRDNVAAANAETPVPAAATP